MTARVAAGRGKCEARFAREMWVGKSEIGDTNLVVQSDRDLQSVRTIRRFAEEFRWNAVVVQEHVLH